MGLMKKLTSAIVASSLVFSLAGSAFAAYTPAAGETAGNRMMGLQILKGKYENDPLALKDEITRAELVTVIVRAFGKEADAALLNGAAAFPDTASHWASGNIAMAKALVEKAGGDAIGMPDGSFQPDGKLTPAQAVAFLMKFLGVKADAAKAWPANFLDKAVELNLITAEDAALIGPMSNDKATRGLVFYMFDRAFYNYDLGAGKTFYTKYVDPTAPVVTLNAVEPTTLDSKVTITGKVEGATEAYVGTKSVTLDANGNFSVDYELPELKEYNIAVTARDLAGNAAEKDVVVTRTSGNAAAIEAAAITVAAGQTVDVAAVVKDAKGNALTGVAVSGESTVGSFADGKFTAGKTAGTGKLALKAGEATATVDVTVVAGPLATVTPSAANVAKGEQVTLTASDEFGNAVTGVSYTMDNSDALLDSAKGIFIGSKAGTFTITGSKDGKTATATVGVYSATVKKLVVSAPTAVVGNTEDVDASGHENSGDVVGTAYEVTVKAVDANGNLVASYDRQIVLPLEAGFVAADDKDAILIHETPGDEDTPASGPIVAIAKDADHGVATFKVLALNDRIGAEYDLTAATLLADGTLVDGDNVDTATVEIGEQVATSVKISTSGTAKYIRSNDGDHTTAVKVYVADQNGKRFLDSTGYDINLSVTGAATIGVPQDSTTHKTSTTTTYSGTSVAVNFESIKGVTGEATLTASVEGLGSATASVTAAVAGKAAKVAVTADATEGVANDVDTITYTIQATDANGVPVVGNYTFKGTLNSDATGEFTVVDQTSAWDAAANDGDGGMVARDTDIELTEGTDKSTFTITTGETQDGTTGTGKATIELSAHKFVGDLKLTLADTATSNKLTEASVTVAFKADEAAKVGLTRTSGISVAAGSPSTQLTAQLYDAAGNVAAVAGKKVTFTGYSASYDSDEEAYVRGSQSGDVKVNGTAKTLEVTTDANGKATVDVSVLGYVGKVFWVEITSADLAVDGAKNLVLVGVNNTIASKLTYSVAVGTENRTRVEAGETVTVTVTAKDSNGKAIAYDSIYLIPSATAYDAEAFNADDLDTGKISKTDGIKLNPVGDGTYTIHIIPATSGSFAFTLKDKSPSTALEQSGSLRVSPSSADHYVANGGDDLTIDEGKASGAITLKNADLFGNAVATSTATKVAVTANKWVDANEDGVVDQAEIGDAVSFGIRTSTAAPDISELTIGAGASQTTFYVWNNLDAGMYVVTFTTGTRTGQMIVEIK